MINESIDIGKVSNLGHDVRRYNFKGPQQHLTLNETTGILKASRDFARFGIFNFDVVMITFNDKLIESKVNLEIKIITEELIRNSGSFQIEGLTPKSFITSSEQESGIEVQTHPVCEIQKDFSFFNDLRDKSKVISLQTACPIFYPPINPSESFTISLGVYPNSTNGNVLYFGQKYIQVNPTVEDFLLLKVVKGHPTLVINAGSGETVISSKCTLTLQQKNIIFIMFDKRKIDFIVQNSNSLTCISSIFLNGKSKVLNINTPIQIGAANQNIFKKSQSNVLNAKISNVYVSNINREDNINQVKPEETTDKSTLHCLIVILFIAVIVLLLIVIKYRTMINKSSELNYNESFGVSYNNSKQAVDLSILQNAQKYQQNDNVEVMGPYSNAKDVRVDDSGIYTIIPYDHSSEVIKSYDAAFKNIGDQGIPSIYAEISENLY
ncbi:unnamed protein product [Diamesa serratosioi]